MHLWRQIAAGAQSHAVILEDDVRLSDAAQQYLKGSDWIPPAAGLIKIERYGDPDQLTLVGKGVHVFGREIAPLRSRHPGSGGYIISREKAALLTALEKIAVPIDQLLFNPVYSPVFRALSPWQMIPAIAAQQTEVGGATDIKRARPPLSQRLKRNLLATLRLPGQIASVLSGNARAVKIKLS
jgi:glycosyl transferase family 25